MTIETKNIFISDETERIKALNRYNILDTPPDASFDKLTKLASRIFNVPISIISLVDANRVWFKSKYGIDSAQVTIEQGLCTSAILSDGIYVIEDAAIDDRSLSNSLVTGELGVRFYAAIPLRTYDGYNLGTFCIIDTKPRTLSNEEQEVLTDLRDIVMDRFEATLNAMMIIAQHHQVLNRTAHDLKNPLTTIPVRADLIKLKKNDPDTVDKMCDQIKVASLNMVNILDELLQSGTVEPGKVQLLLVKLNISQVVSNVVAMNHPLAERKGQTLSFTSETQVSVKADEGKISEIIDNLINNAIKYAPVNTNISVRVNQVANKVLVEVQDEGQGLTEDDMMRLYQRFTRLSAQPTGGENSTGLGLSIVKLLTEAHGGRVWAESDGKGKGAMFVVELPVYG